jgi:hypothetical protein
LGILAAFLAYYHVSRGLWAKFDEEKKEIHPPRGQKKTSPW